MIISQYPHLKRHYFLRTGGRRDFSTDFEKEDVLLLYLNSPFRLEDDEVKPYRFGIKIVPI